MTEADAIDAIQQCWIDGWLPLHPSDPNDAAHVPFLFDNEAFDPTELNAVDAWARVAVIHTTANQITMGPTPSRRFERRGMIAVQLFAAVNKGRAQLAALADDVRAVLEATRIVVAGDNEAMVTFAATTRELPTDGRWCMQVVTVPIKYYRQG